MPLHVLTITWLYPQLIYYTFSIISTLIGAILLLVSPKPNYPLSLALPNVYTYPPPVNNTLKSYPQPTYITGYSKGISTGLNIILFLSFYNGNITTLPLVSTAMF